MMMIDVPFFDWLFPRDPPLSEDRTLTRTLRLPADCLTRDAPSFTHLDRVCGRHSFNCGRENCHQPKAFGLQRNARFHGILRKWRHQKGVPIYQKEHLVRQQQRSKSRAPSSNASSSDLLSDGDSSTDGRDSSAGGDSTTGGGSEESGRTKTGSWIVHHDNHGVPYWINDVTGEATYALFIHHMGRGTPITYVENRHPYQLRSPATPPPSTTATIGYPSTTNETSSSSNGSKVGNIGGTSDVGDNSNKSDETSIRKAEKSCGGRGRPGGVWEELYHKVTGAKIWYHTGTKKTTTKDPFF